MRPKNKPLLSDVMDYRKRAAILRYRGLEAEARSVELELFLADLTKAAEAMVAAFEQPDSRRNWSAVEREPRLRAPYDASDRPEHDDLQESYRSHLVRLTLETVLSAGRVPIEPSVFDHWFSAGERNLCSDQHLACHATEKGRKIHEKSAR